ncbi:hypothetical protein GCM10007416_21350 [Kroppenstedtia guangzhouensis]|uniref:Uncharacterized protein n=1 Tax=Kroppenstedtia guangzhouensis TaxID=1274356 RepID=A0ABQ1GPH0_9BACL|nr:hypothetical protein [Kroppenstedtia guangzhouensis]GGA47901.1 hypothetical protein GCM10007416_21350 [Kroppenstedtia guangzhouensis]
MKKRVRALSMVWLAVFILTLLMPPFQALAENNEGYKVDVKAMSTKEDNIAVDAEVVGEQNPIALNGEWIFFLIDNKSEVVEKSKPYPVNLIR